MILKIYTSKDNANAGKEFCESLSFIVKNYVNEDEEEVNDYDNYLSAAAVTNDDNEFKQASTRRM